MMNRVRTQTVFITLALFATMVVLPGCASQQTCESSDLQRVRETVRRATERPPIVIAEPVVPLKPPQNVLVLTGGGMYGAYTAGFLSGWTKSGTRPEFDVVTGVSTGALIATVAFLGSDYDDAAREFYTAIQGRDIYTPRAWILVPYAGSIASSEPLRKLIVSIADEKFIAHVAAEHRKGRRLYVGTTNLETRKPVIWDMGAIATCGGPDCMNRFRSVLLASCSVPGMLPPVAISSQRNGQTVVEYHADGGTTAQLFVPPGTLNTKPDGSPSGTNVHICVAGKLFADQVKLKPRILPVLGASATSILYAHTRTEIAAIYHQTRLTGGNFFLTALPDSDNGQTLGLGFDKKEMARLYEVGYYHGIGGPAWMTAPPFEGAATDPPRE